MSYQTQQNQRKLIDLLIESFPEGLKTGELAEQMQVSTQTVRNYIDELSGQGFAVTNEGGRYALDPADNPRQLYLSLPYAWLLYLPLRRIVRANLNRRTLVRDLLSRISESLLHGELAEQLLEEVVDDDTPVDTTFQILVDAWRRGLYVQVKYRVPDAVQTTTLQVAPWWFEPAVWSDSNYLIGGLLQGSQIKPITLKLDRIQDVKPLLTTFERPNTHELLTRIREAWGIWQGEDSPVTVGLRFANRQYDRLRETHWHPTEQTRVDADGSILWEALISEPREMKPWIRGWGPDVEVLEPEWLRDEIAAEAAQTARLYGRDTGSEIVNFF